MCSGPEKSNHTRETDRPGAGRARWWVEEPEYHSERQSQKDDDSEIDPQGLLYSGGEHEEIWE